MRQKDRRGQTWRMEKPLKALADGEEATRMIAELSDTVVERVLTENTQDLKPFWSPISPTGSSPLLPDDGRRTPSWSGASDPGGSLLYLKPKERVRISWSSPPTLWMGSR